MSLVLQMLTLAYPEEHPDRDVKMAAHTRMDHQIGWERDAIQGVIRAQLVIKVNCLFNKYLLNAYCVPETVLGTRDMAVKTHSKTHPALLEPTS